MSCQTGRRKTAQREGAKMAKINITYVLIAILLIGALFVGGVLKLPAQSIGGGQATTQPEQAQAVPTCEQSTALTLTYSVFDETAGNTATSLNSDYNLVYYFGSAYAGNIAAGSSITGIPTGTTVTIYAVDAGGAHDVYGFNDVVQMGCKSEAKSVPRGMQDSAVTVVMYDVSTGIEAVNTDTAPVTLGAGQAVDAQWYVKASTSNARFGTTQEGAKALLVIDYNGLIYKQPVISSIEGGVASVDVVPNGHVSTAVTANATTSVAYLITTNNLANNKHIKINFKADTLTASVNPAATDGNIGVTLYDSEQYQKLDGTWVVGFRNADTGADLGEPNATDIFHVQ